MIRKKSFVAGSSEMPGELVSEISPLPAIRPSRSRVISFWQIVRFALVGVANTGIDVLFLNALLFLYPVHDGALLVVFNTLAYTVGAVNSFLLNKYWTFRRREMTTSRHEILTFAVVSVLGICCNNLLLILCARMTHPAFLRPVLWTNMAKVGAVTGTSAVSFLGMRLWVFASRSRKKSTKKSTLHPTKNEVSSREEAPLLE